MTSLSLAARRRPPGPTRDVARYEHKRDALIAAAAGLVNARGLRGMTLADVGARVGLTTTSVAYYFRRKEELAEAVYLSSIARYRALFIAAAGEGDTGGRTAAAVRLFFELSRRIREGQAAPLADFSDIRELGVPQRDVVVAAYLEMVQAAATLFDLTELNPRRRTLRASLLLAVLYWMGFWTGRYDPADHERIAARLSAILVDGLAAAYLPSWPPTPTSGSAAAGEAQDALLVAATRLINIHGYHGVSIDRIAGELGLSKGAFYHHHESKDGLVAACFERTFGVLQQVRRAAAARPGDGCTRLAAACAALTHYQLSSEGPLLRFSALTALSPPVASRMIAKGGLVFDGYAGLVSDAIADGSCCAVDANIAAQVINAAINAIPELALWFPDIGEDEVREAYLRPMLLGLPA